MICQICNKELKQLSYFHLKMHGISTHEYKKKFNCETLMDKNILDKISFHSAGSNNPMFGKHMSDEAKEKIRNNKERSKKLSKFMTEFRKTHSVAKENNPMYGKKHTKESVEKMSRTVCDQIASGRNLCANHKKGWFHSDKQNKDIWYDSSYELKALEILERDENCLKFGRTNFKVPYLYEGITKNTVPDFIVNDKLVIEVKPKRRVFLEKERIKIEAAYSYCIARGLDFIVWTEKEIGK